MDVCDFLEGSEVSGLLQLAPAEAVRQGLAQRAVNLCSWGWFRRYPVRRDDQFLATALANGERHRGGHGLIFMPLASGPCQS